MRWPCSLVAVLLLACAEGGGGTGDGGPRRDASRDDGGEDPMDDAGRRDGGRRDASISCPAGQHACGGGCIDDLANDPANGCRLGCGEACPAPPAGTTACSMAGACTFTCTSPFRMMGDTCVCTARTCEDMGWECGAPDDGCGMPLDCGSCGTGTCIDGACACMPDPHEENDSNTTATRIATLNDADAPRDSIVSDDNIDELTDVDWLRWEITDGTDFGNPQITVTLDQIPIGSTYQLSTFYACNGGMDATSCTGATVDDEIGHGCTSSGTTVRTHMLATDCEHASTDDSGVLLVRVRAPSWGSTCEPYRVTVRVR